MRDFFIAGLMLAAAPVAIAEQSSQGWCFEHPSEDVRANIFASTVSENSGAVKLIFTDAEENQNTFNLSAVGVNEYTLVGGRDGDGVVFRADGHLEMYDSEGESGSAAPSTEHDCIG
ncbi:hypothetical protein D1224_03980 [Henriciella barbarensis]|uniref:C-type lysozyme inhibitor domain-containing protein n=1 Tax=Henriciella barbarensis TaxID=86342 RepID=A0A399R0Z2_9PROT|nr:hypothetical protein [Henriciella barbarensis]RIJ23432.1 hypothetical protein D1224_03980 [Henriciella barbarensis]